MDATTIFAFVLFFVFFLLVFRYVWNKHSFYKKERKYKDIIYSKKGMLYQEKLGYKIVISDFSEEELIWLRKKGYMNNFEDQIVFPQQDFSRFVFENFSFTHLPMVFRFVKMKLTELDERFVDFMLIGKGGYTVDEVRDGEIVLLGKIGNRITVKQEKILFKKDDRVYVSISRKPTNDFYHKIFTVELFAR